ncbi:M20 metallopeptidase family protein [Yinghuangia soli]|uniref:M20 family metallopeptidase n=1 Tax=Yinghuangia soli TaxID=2908204 RepID=A0AA41Q3G2_9ACTN|nr:M20 family metallopeptidase [Yinghuangia soli]MCF2530839.1 M20 family metallopeptidase [Yinghuangia soli]
MTVLEDARALHDDLVRMRHDLHARPEIGLDLPFTQDRVLAELAPLPLEITTGRALSSVTAVLRGARPGPTVLLRGDMDALPVTERSGVPYASTEAGRMHACGHDMHTTMLAGAAHLLAARRDTLAGNVVFMFQPGEEGPGGAGLMIDEGVLDASGERAVAAYALHVASAMLPQGLFSARAGTALAAADSVTVTVRGQGGHGSMPHLARDPIPAACEMVTALQAMVTRKYDIFDPVVVTVGSFHAGAVDNVIPGEAVFSATLRSFSREAHGRIKDDVVAIVRGVAGAHGLEADVDFGRMSYPVTVNDEDAVGHVGTTIREVLGEERFRISPKPGAGAEDFSLVLDDVPGALVMLGACPADRELAKAPANHAPEAAFDDAVLADGTAIYAELALRRLASAEEAAEVASA